MRLCQHAFFTSVLAYSENNAAITPVDLLIGCPANAVLAWRYRREANWRVWLPMALMMFIGIIPGVFILKNVDGRIVKMVFGIVVTFAGVEMILRKHRHRQTRGSRTAMLLTCVLSGVLCGLYGVGALLAAYFSRTAKDVGEFKGNLSIVFLLENLFRIVLYSVTGIITPDAVKRAALMLPCMALGLFLGMKCADRLKENVVKHIVMLMLVLSGMVLFVTNLK